eukprot:TRINITY_DN24052_c0_g1_i4.p1 TRINITY_DN24052_c0_g1~~TRINITY_DN24052_c0_g1_i4.p1  ORF type:complete len:440 (+),score=41.07 TRINITY_DN24052_c0_g1_i4:177-1496(+)
MCLFIGVVPAETTARIWDCFMQDGRDVIFRATVGLLRMHSTEILACQTFEDVFQKLKTAPLGTFDADALLSLAYEDDSVLSRLMELRVQKQDEFSQEVASRPHALPLSIPGVECHMDLAEMLDSVTGVEDQSHSNTSDESSDQDETSSTSSDTSDDEGAVTNGTSSAGTDEEPSTSQNDPVAAKSRPLAHKAWLSGPEESTLRRILFPHELKEYEQKYSSLVGSEQACLGLECFRKTLLGPDAQPHLFIDRVFRLLDLDSDGYLSMYEYIRGMHLLSRGSAKEQATFLFQCLDFDQTGSVSRALLIKVLKLQFQQYVATRQPDDDGSTVAKGFDAISLLVNSLYCQAQGEQEDAKETLTYSEFLELCIPNKPKLTSIVHDGSIGTSHEREAKLKMVNDDLYTAHQELLDCPRSMRSTLKQKIEDYDRVRRELHDFHRSL